MNRTAGALGVMCLGLMVTGCPEDKKQPPSSATASATADKPAASGSAAATGSATKPAAKPEGAVCKSEDKKVWGKWANPRTGLTATSFEGGKIAVGVALGDRPHMLVFDAEGEGSLSRVRLGAGHALGTRVKPADGVRHLQRVTVTAGNRAFADYRDKYQDGRRRIACGPLASKKPFLVYDGKPLLSSDDTGKGRQKTPEVPPDAPVPKTPPADAPDAGVKAGGEGGGDSVAADAGPGKAPAGSGGGQATDGAGGGAAAPAPDPKPASQEDEPTEPKTLRELRDCRTFADPSGSDIWAVGSELVGDLKGDSGERRWKMRFFVAPNEGRGREITLLNIAFDKEPKKLHTLEAPVAHRLADGNYVLAGRYRGRLYTWLLDSKKNKKSELHKYSGGYPSLPRILSDGVGHVLLTSQKIDPKSWKLRALTFDKTSKLLQELLRLDVGEDDDSLAEPTFARVGDQRWLAYHAGDRRKGHVTLVPIDENLRQAGASYVATDQEHHAYESHLFARKDGKLLLVYIQQPDGSKAPELVSEVLSCEVRK